MLCGVFNKQYNSVKRLTVDAQGSSRRASDTEKQLDQSSSMFIVSNHLHRLIVRTGFDMQTQSNQACSAGASHAEADIGHGRKGWH